MPNVKRVCGDGSFSIAAAISSLSFSCLLTGFRDVVLVIANELFRTGLADIYEYERPVEGTVVPGKMRPDFSFVDPAGELLLWEHLGMLGRDDYRRAWEWKKEWYTKNGFEMGKNLFTTEDDAQGGLDSGVIKKVVQRIKERL